MEKMENMSGKPAECYSTSLSSDVSVQAQSYFKNLNITPINGSNSFFLQGSQYQVQFEIPISCWNPYWTTISFQIGTAFPNADANTKNVGIWSQYCPFFNRCELYSSQGNVYLCNVQQMDVYTRLAMQLNLDSTKRDAQMGGINNSARAGNVNAGQPTFGNAGRVAADNYIGDSLLVSDTTGANVYAIPAPNSVTPGFLNTPVATGTGNPGFLYSMRLGDLLPDSIFNCNNSFWLSKVLYLRLTFNPYTNIITNYNFTAGVAPQVTAPTALPGAVTGIQINQLSLQLRIEGDERAIAARKALAETASSVVFPYVYNFSQSSQGGGQMQTSYTLASDNSAIFKLFRLYSGILRTGGTQFPIDFSNYGQLQAATTTTPQYVANSVYNNIYLAINGIVVEQFNLDPNSANFMLQQIKQYFPNASINNNTELQVYGGYATQFNTEEVPENNIDLYSPMKAMGLDASRSNLAINIQYDTTSGKSISPGTKFNNQGTIYLFPVVMKSFIYSQGNFTYG